jgi:Major Facilitator Superfamily
LLPWFLFSFMDARMFRRLGRIIGVVVLIGCAAYNRPNDWVSRTDPPRDFASDNASCVMYMNGESRADAATGANSFVNLLNQQTNYRNCMVSLGWGKAQRETGVANGASASDPAGYGVPPISLNPWATVFSRAMPWLRLMPRSVPDARANPTATPDIREILGHRSAWGCFVGQFSSNYLWYFLLTWVPFYLVHERHFSLSDMARIGGLAYLSIGVAALVSGRLSDRWIRAGRTATQVRKSAMLLGQTGAAVSLVLCVVASSRLSVVFLILACVAYGVTAPMTWAFAQTPAAQRLPASGRDCKTRWET